MNPSKDGIEGLVFCVALLTGLALTVLVARTLRRLVADGKMPRFLATVIQGVALFPLCVAPMLVANGARFVAGLFGVVIFNEKPGNQGVLVGIGILGVLIPIVTLVVLALVDTVRGIGGGPSRRFDVPPQRPDTSSRKCFPDLPPSQPRRTAERRDTSSR